MTTNFFHPSLLLRFLGPGSEIRDPGQEKNQDPGSGINIPDPQHCLAERLILFFIFRIATATASPLFQVQLRNLRHKT
jgi:hypothetical protein